MAVLDCYKVDPITEIKSYISTILDCLNIDKLGESLGERESHILQCLLSVLSNDKGKLFLLDPHLLKDLESSHSLVFQAGI